MKGILKEATLFVKLITISYLAVCLLSIYFALTNYELVFVSNKYDRESLVMGDALLAASCLAETTYDGIPIKGLLSEDKIKTEKGRSQSYISSISCVRYPRGIYIDISYQDSTLYNIGDPSVYVVENYNSSFPAVLNRSGSMVPVAFTIFVPKGA